MSYDGFYKELSERGTSNEILSQVLDAKEEVLHSQDAIAVTANEVKTNLALAQGAATSSNASSIASAASANRSETSASSALTSQNVSLEAASRATNEATKSTTSATNSAASAAASEASRVASRASELAAKDSETKAKVSETNAKVSETSSKASEVAAKTSETNSKVSETNSKDSETKSKVSETNSKSSETVALAAETRVGILVDRVSNIEYDVSMVNAAKAAAKTSETNAKASEVAAKTSGTSSKASEVAAKTSETNATTSATVSATRATSAEAAATSATASKNAAATSATQSANSANQSLLDANRSKTEADRARVAANEAVEATSGKQPLNANLSAFSLLSGEASKLPYFTGQGALSLTNITVKARHLLASSSSEQMHSALDLVPVNSLTDRTANSLVRTGWLGYGGTLLAMDVDFSNLPPYSFSFIGQNAVSAPVEGDFYVEHRYYDVSNSDVTATHIGTGKKYFRTKTGYWSPWRSAEGIWGSITGSLSAQDDLQAALNTKATVASVSLMPTSTTFMPFNADRVAAILPAGGTWAYWIHQAAASTGTLIGMSSAGTAAGGTTIKAAAGNQYILGFCWRIT